MINLDDQNMNGDFLPEKINNFTFRDIIKIITKSKKVIILFVFLGLVSAIVYLMLTPSKYEVIAQIRMAQISQINPTNPFGMAIEDPAALISRMQFPTNYPEKVIQACGYMDRSQPGLSLSKDLKFSTLKGVSNTVELKLLSVDRDVAFRCAEAVFEQISTLQERVSAPFVEEAKIKLVADNERIDAARKLISKADQSGSAMSAAYLSARDELTYFLTDREKMIDLINSIKTRGTQLSSPIYVSEKPVTPKKLISLLFGIFAGFILGLLVVVSKLKFSSLNH